MTKSQAHSSVDHFSLKGRDILPWLLIVILLSACAYLVDFSVNKWGTLIDLGQTIVANQQSISDQHEKLRSSVEARLTNSPTSSQSPRKNAPVSVSICPTPSANECSTKEIDKCSLPSPDSSLRSSRSWSRWSTPSPPKSANSSPSTPMSPSMDTPCSPPSPTRSAHVEPVSSSPIRLPSQQ